MDIGCGGLFGIPQSDKLPPKPPQTFESGDQNLRVSVRKQIPIRKSKSMMGRPAMLQRQFQSHAYGSQSSVSSEGSTGSGGSGITSIGAGGHGYGSVKQKPICIHGSLRRARKDSFPVYDIDELEVSDTQVDVVLPGGINLDDAMDNLPEYIPTMGSLRDLQDDEPDELTGTDAE